MSLSLLAVRIPESMHKYIKHKCVTDQKKQQDLVREMIDLYQKQDPEYMEKLNQLGLVQDSKEARHDA